MLHVAKGTPVKPTNIRARPVFSNDSSKSRKAKHASHKEAVSKEDFDEFCCRFLELLDSPVALGVWLRYKHGEHADLVKAKVNPLDYPSPDAFRRDYAAVRFFSKFTGLTTGIDKKQVALQSATIAEELCKETNLRLLRYRAGSERNIFEAEFFRTKNLIARILGPLPASFKDVGWSPGRTTSAWGEALSSVHKYASRPDVTWSAQLKALALLRTSPNWAAAILDSDGPCSILRCALNVVEGNVLITVPKNAKTDRVICYEPHLNLRLQLQVGSYMKHRLKRAGVDLTDQSINQRRAAYAAKHGSLATIDLSMASDTLSRELVFELLPIDWALYLDDIRSKRTIWPDGSVRENQKFSSMGNGFTFELESLIFYALMKSVTDNVSVFGDDIIIPTPAYERAFGLLNAAGFQVNTEKSYSYGPFRESCGYDAFAAVNVTPVYLRDLPRSTLDWVKIHNRVRDWVSRDFVPEIRFADLLKWMRLTHTHFHGPQGYGDGHYHVNFEEATPNRAPFGLEGWWYKSVTLVARSSRLYGDRVHGHFSGRFSYAALCAATGPKRSFDTVVATADRRLVTYVTIRSLATSWPTVNYC